MLSPPDGRRHLLRYAGCLGVFLGLSSGVVVVRGEVDFTRDIRPILSNHCFSCHGPDDQGRQGGLRLDEQQASRQATESGAFAIVPGAPDRSALVARIESTDEHSVMPPPSFQKPLSPSQKARLREWIASGADYAPHWAFSPPQTPRLPDVAQRRWANNEIDLFVLDRLDREGLRPSPEADRATWLRRVCLDLTGLPPTPDELAKFLADKAPDAHAKVVDRLLQSPRHGERMAMQWLDAARFADTNGYNNDETRTMWPWRDWLIDAFSRGMPYDQFLTDQLAGDLLPNATLPQTVASGFNRNHVITTEGGVIAEEYHVEYVADRVHTTATVFLGMSMQCARCHDHKYDPFSQRDYYRFAAFFDNVPDTLTSHQADRMAGPLIKVPSRIQRAEQIEIETRRKNLEQQLQRRQPYVDGELASWTESLSRELVDHGLEFAPVVHFPLDELEGATLRNVSEPARPGQVRGSIESCGGKVGSAIKLDGESFVDAGQTGAFDGDSTFTMALWFRATSGGPAALVSKMDDEAAHRGYDVLFNQGQLECHLVDQWPDRAIKVKTQGQLPLDQWHHVVVSYDGSRRATGVAMYVDGEKCVLTVETDQFQEGSLQTGEPLRIGRRQTSASFQGSIDDLRLYSVVCAPEEIRSVMEGNPLSDVRSILRISSESRTEKQRDRLREHFLAAIAPDPVTANLRRELAAVADEERRLDEAVPRTMAMSESESRRTTHILRRGQYDQPVESVEPGVPDALSAPRQTPVRDRLELARWLSDSAHPLTARVAVNRWWESCFGTGLVETVEDFGIQGSPPSHPELLDWMATELVRSGWDVRAMLRRIVLSSTYRQSSRISPDLARRDPNNRLLARGPRYRLPAEMVRDNALAIGGLLACRIGGPSVKPYQPAGLWEDVSVLRRVSYTPDVGEGLYRRGMYTFWKRTCPPPTMSTFDAPDRETCVLRRARTNTPLQSLVLLNDPTYVEAARGLAVRVITTHTVDDDRITAAYLIALSRPPRAEERQVLAGQLSDSRAWFQSHPDDARALNLVGQMRPQVDLSDVDLAAWTTVSSIVLNLDETISKR